MGLVPVFGDCFVSKTAQIAICLLYLVLLCACGYRFAGSGSFPEGAQYIFIEVIDEHILEKLHAIRMLGNKAAHGRNAKSSDALALLRDAYLIGQWIFKTYSGSIDDSYPPYSEPSNPDIERHDLSQNNKDLEAQLAKVKEELLRLETSEKIAQNQALELKMELDQVKIDEFKNASLKAASQPGRTSPFRYRMAK